MSLAALDRAKQVLGDTVTASHSYRGDETLVVNPLFIVRKGNMSWPRALRLIAKNIIANVVKSAFPERYIDRWGRLKGNMIGLVHAARGKLDPMHALKL